jgi:hypothetical protein
MRQQPATGVTQWSAMGGRSKEASAVKRNWSTFNMSSNRPRTCSMKKDGVTD